MTVQLHDRCLVTSHFAADFNQMCLKCTLSNNTVLKALQNINKLPGDVVAGSGEEKGYYLKKKKVLYFSDIRNGFTLRMELAAELAVGVCCGSSQSPLNSCFWLAPKLSCQLIPFPQVCLLLL